jgi:hypothetical protein
MTKVKKTINIHNYNSDNNLEKDNSTAIYTGNEKCIEKNEWKEIKSLLGKYFDNNLNQIIIFNNIESFIVS